MQVTTLNRTIAMFIVGGAPLTWFLLRNLSAFTNFAEVHKESGAALALVFTLALIPMVAVCGMIVEGVAEFPRYYLVKKSARRRKLAGFFFHRDEFDELTRLCARIVKLMDECKPHFKLGPKTDADRMDAMNFVAGYFLANASSTEIDWLNAHYSTHSLAGSLATLIPMLGVLDWCFYGGYGWREAVLIVVASYLAISVAIDMYIYSYHMAARFTFIDLEFNEKGMPSDRQDGGRKAD